jgi:hypothetical protein
MLTLEPERLKNRLTTTRNKDHRRWKGFFTRDAQAACDFSFSASKFSPFFHSAAEPQPKHFGKRSAVSAQLQL